MANLSIRDYPRIETQSGNRSKTANSIWCLGNPQDRYTVASKHRRLNTQGPKEMVAVPPPSNRLVVVP